MSCGQGTAARACLSERLPFLGFTLSEVHSKKLELQLTDFIVSEMQREGSTHYRPEAVQQVDTEEAEGKPVPKPKPKGVSKPKPKNQGKNKKETDGATGEEEEAGKPPNKKPRTETGEENPSDPESLPW